MMRARELVVVTAVLAALSGPGVAGAATAKQVEALFIGNSYTFRNNLTVVVKQLAEAGNPGLSVAPTKIIYGGRTLRDHWEYFRTQDLLRLPDLTEADLEAACTELRDGQQKAKGLPGKGAKDAGRYAAAVRNHQAWARALHAPPSWDYVVLQSWRDTDGGQQSPYAVYARKFAELAHGRGAKVILYATGPRYQNATPLSAPPDPTPALEETRSLVALARELDALLVPMPFVISRCQTTRPGLVLRWRNDGHLNQACAYLTACTFYSVLFGKSPEGLPVAEVTDPKIVDKAKPDQDPDGGPRRVVFPDELRSFLQSVAWEAVEACAELAAGP